MVLRGAVLAAVLAAAGLVSAQETADGGPGLSGVWGRDLGGDMGSVGPDDIPFQPWAREVFKQSREDSDADLPFVDNRTICLPDGAVDVMFTPYLIRLVQTPAKLHMLLEFNNQIRTVHLGASHPADPEPRWYGHSVGRWEGGNLVIETIGLNDRTPLMTLFAGLTGRSNIPHTDALRVVEEFVLSDDGTALIDRMTFHDPGAYTEPWTIQVPYSRREGEEAKITEFVCADDPEVHDPDLEGMITVGAEGKFLLDL